MLKSALLIAAISVPALAQPKIRVTNGQVSQEGNRFEIKSKSSRFEFEDRTGEQLSIQVTYKGATSEQSTLGSGQVVSQVALKLRSENQCNLVYVARRFSPKSEIVVFLKQNDGQSTHQECEDRGYKRIASIGVPMIGINNKFSLSGAFDGDMLTVLYDGKNVWSGRVSWNRKGKAGIRTDNANVSIEMN